MMNKTKASISSRTMILLIGAVLLCAIGLTGAVGATQASLNYESEQYQARMGQTHLGVALLEQSGAEADATVVNVGDEGSRLGFEGSRDGKLMQRTTGEGDATRLTVLGVDKQMIPGKAYTEKIFAQNASDMDEYVRLTIRKYWADENGNKLYNIAPDFLKLIVLETPTNSKWAWSEAESTPEMDVYYYKGVLPAREVSSNVIESIKLDPMIANVGDALKATNNGNGNVQVCLSAEVDAVQTNHVADAVKSAWGVDLIELNKLDLGWEDKPTLGGTSEERKGA